MGSPSTEEGRDPDELQHKQRIGRTFAIAAKSVTVEQYRKFKPRYGMGEIEHGHARPTVRSSARTGIRRPPTATG